MRIDKAMATVQSMREPRRLRFSRAARSLTYQPPAPQRHWTWDAATPHERACFVRENRKLGVMDWDLLDLFCLTPAGLAEIVKGKDWMPHHHAAGQTPTDR